MNYSDSYATSGTIPSGGNNMCYTRRPNTRFEISPLDEDFCYPPSGAIATNVLSDEATIVWRANENASGVFGLDYKLSDEEDWTTASTSISDTFYTISSLTSLTDYDVRVYGICTADNSTYSSVSFRTAPSEENCLVLPYEQNFDDVENITNWNFSQGTTGPLWYFGTAENNTTDDSGELTEGGALYISDNNGTSANYDSESDINSVAYTYVNLEPDTRYVVEFDWKNLGETGWDYLQVFLTDHDTELSLSSIISTGAVCEGLAGQSTWQRKGILLPESATGVKKLVFAWQNDGSSGNNPPASVDNLVIRALECNPADSLTIDWTMDESEAITATVTI